MSNACGGIEIAPALVGTIWSQLAGAVTGHVVGSVQFDIEGPYLEESWLAACSRVLDLHVEPVLAAGVGLHGGDERLRCAPLLTSCDLASSMTEQPSTLIRPPHPSERGWIERQLLESWGSTIVVSRGLAHDASRLPALVAVEGDELVGLATFALNDTECELVTLDALRQRRGIGSALLARVAEQAAERGCRRVWLITTNDNIDAIRFYQRRGMRLIAVHPGAVDEARRIKPTIPVIGEHGIPIHDELEFELRLS